MAIARRRFVAHCMGALAVVLSVAPAFAYDWLQFGGDAQHSGNNIAETILNAGNVGWLAQKYSATLPATADGAPVFLEAVTTPGGVKNRLFVTTRDGWIIALDAQNGTTVWGHRPAGQSRHSRPRAFHLGPFMSA